MLNAAGSTISGIYYFSIEGSDGSNKDTTNFKITVEDGNSNEPENNTNSVKEHRKQVEQVLIIHRLKMNNYFSSIKGKSIINKLMEFKKIELILLKKLFFKIVLFCFTFLIQINLDASVKSFQEKNRDILREKEKIEKELGSKEKSQKKN